MVTAICFTECPLFNAHLLKLLLLVQFLLLCLSLFPFGCILLIKKKVLKVLSYLFQARAVFEIASLDADIKHDGVDSPLPQVINQSINATLILLTDLSKYVSHVIN